MPLPTLTEARDSALAAAERVVELRATPADKRGETFAADLRAATAETVAADTVFGVVQRTAVPEPRDGRGPEAGTRRSGREVDTRSAGERFTDAEGYEAFATRGGTGHFEFGVGEVRALLTTSAADAQAGGLFLPRGTPFLMDSALSRRRLFVRDVLAGGTTGLNSVPYIRELAPRTNEAGATTVAEGAPKPEVTVQFAPADAPVRKIAAWLPATTEVLADAPTLRAYIDARLAYMLLLREEEQVLNGSGTAPDLRGIRQTAGLQTVPSPAGDNLVGIARGIRNIELVDGEPDGVAINPTDYWAMLTRRASATAGTATYGSAEFDLNPFADPATLRPWGLPPIKTRSMPAGTALVGAWRIGAQLLDRQETVIRVGDQHVDYFTTNKVAILAEERVALLNHRPDFFAEVVFS